MRFLSALTLVAALGGITVYSADDALEVSTGFLIGARYDSHLFYVKPANSSSWKKSYAGELYRKEAQGRLLGAILSGLDSPVEPLKESGFNFARLALQTSEWSMFSPSGQLRKESLSALRQLLEDTARAGIAVELVLFHPDQDENFDSPEAIVASAQRLTDWLIDENYRHVLINPSHLWQAPGWDYDHFVPQNLDRIAGAIRERFQWRRTGFALPIALSAPMHSVLNPKIVEHSDVLIAAGEGAPMDPRSVERPILVEHADPRSCAAAFARFAGCLVSQPVAKAVLSPLGSLVLKGFKQ